MDPTPSRFPLIEIPLKTTKSLDFEPVSKSLIIAMEMDPSKFTEAIKEFQAAREGVRFTKDSVQRDSWYRYYAQCELAQLRFAFDDALTFTWHDAFTDTPIDQTSFAFEKASILFNLC